MIEWLEETFWLLVIFLRPQAWQYIPDVQCTLHLPFLSASKYQQGSWVFIYWCVLFV